MNVPQWKKAINLGRDKVSKNDAYYSRADYIRSISDSIQNCIYLAIDCPGYYTLPTPAIIKSLINWVHNETARLDVIGTNVVTFEEIKWVR